MEFEPQIFKVVVLGDVNAGQTTFLNQCQRIFSKKEEYDFLHDQFSIIPFLFKDGFAAKVEIWEKYGRNSKYYAGGWTRCFRKANGVFLLFDLTNREGFDNLKYWVQEIKDHVEEETLIMLLGNKLDLVQQNPEARQVNVHEAEDFANLNGLMYKEISAKDKENVKEIFSELMESIYEEKKKNEFQNKELKQKDISLEKSNVRSDKCL